MAYTSITKPTQGDATKKSLIDAVIDNLAHFNTEVQKIRSDQIANGSFELDSNADGYPDNWTWAASGSGGSGTVYSTDQANGLYSFKIEHPGGSSNGGGSLTTDDYMECSCEVPVFISWEQKSSVAGVLNLVQIQWFTAAQASVSTTTIYTSTNNPTSWKVQHGGAMPPSTARYFKVKFTGGDTSNTTGGTILWDNFRVWKPQFLNTQQYSSAGTHYWFCPLGVSVVRVTCVGGGAQAGGVSAAGYPSGGGGGGGTIIAYVNVTAGTSYACVVGAGGSSGTSTTNGTAGGNTTFGSTLAVANGGASGVLGNGSGAGTGGAGGTTSTTGTSIKATSGSAGAAGNAAGFVDPKGGEGGATEYAGTTATGSAGTHPGAGGACPSTQGTAGGAGANGLILLEW